MRIRNTTNSTIVINDLPGPQSGSGLSLPPGEEILIFNEDAERSSQLGSFLTLGNLTNLGPEEPNTGQPQASGQPTIIGGTQVQASGTPSAGQLLITTDSEHATWQNAAGGGVPDASTTVKGLVKTSVAPAVANNPIAVGDNDPRNTNSRAPSGAASNDLSGSYPGPTVAKINGIALSGTPSTGQVLTATSPSAANWQTPSGGGSLTGGGTTGKLAKWTGGTVLGDSIISESGSVLSISGTIDNPTGAQNKIRFHFNQYNDLPTAATYHGMFAHVHDILNNGSNYGGAYFAHSAGWMRLLHQDITSGYQNVYIGPDAASVKYAATSALLELDSTAKGFLTPRMTLAQRNAISGPAEGLTLYVNDAGEKKPYFHNGTSWLLVGSGLPSSSLSDGGSLIKTSTALGSDLSGNLPNATVAKINGVSLGSAPTTGQVLTATSATAATWQTPSGGGGASTDYNQISLYEAVSISGYPVWVKSSSTARVGLSWTRVTTVLTVNDIAHGHTSGDRVIVRNTNQDYISATIATTPTADSFTVATTNSGAASGSAASYSMGFTYAHNAGAGSITSGTLTAPANSNVQLLSLRLYLAASTRSTTTYDVILPPSATNGAGGDSSEDDLYVPITAVRQHSLGSDVTMTSVGFTLTKAVGGNFARFQLAALGATTTPINIQMGF